MRARCPIRFRPRSGPRRPAGRASHNSAPVDAEPVSAFVGRLLGAQNQLAALRVHQLDQPELRRRLDEAMRDGTAEVVEMLSGAVDDQHAAAAVEAVSEVLAEYARRLAELV